jgi:hypothetical protein
MLEQSVCVESILWIDSVIYRTICIINLRLGQSYSDSKTIAYLARPQKNMYKYMVMPSGTVTHCK